MLKFWKSQSKSLVGIDFSSSAIKCLHFERLPEGGLVLKQFASELLAPKVVLERDIKNPQAVVDALIRLQERLKLSGSTVALSVAGASVVTRVIQIAQGLNDKEINNQIIIEADRYIPYPLEEAYYDYQVLGPSLKHPELQDALLASARIEDVDARLAILSGAGLDVSIIDIESLCIERAFELVAQQLPDHANNKRVGLIEIGANLTSLYVFENHKLIYNRDQNFGGQQLLEEIEKRYGLSFEDANHAMRMGNLPEDYQQEVLEPFKETVSQQVSRTLQFFYSSENQGALDYLVISGGTCNIGELDEIIAQKLGIKTFIANPFHGVKIDSEVNTAALNQEAVGLLVCCGLALRNCHDS